MSADGYGDKVEEKARLFHFVIYIFHDTIVLRVKFEGGISTIALLERIREVINKRIQEKKKMNLQTWHPLMILKMELNI